jgi:hypothetical protein
MWQLVDARPATCLDLKLVYRGIRSAGYRQDLLCLFIVGELTHRV